eukprot:CAMPEP_0175684126 /NCGR_PEP_ID=MMETSP0097-20121207/26679_1 /TAXON_ID=311494 /ORGANISM="Alexandrium monilatum, Strain CCMP3105" /LENGTH=385 /DNA_ID=CAMNT_0016991051 /DNA_START=51 /DNA_END=1207 /DNA_ORIENTATION=+
MAVSTSGSGSQGHPVYETVVGGHSAMVQDILAGFPGPLRDYLPKTPLSPRGKGLPRPGSPCEQRAVQLHIARQESARQLRVSSWGGASRRRKAELDYEPQRAPEAAHAKPLQQDRCQQRQPQDDTSASSSNAETLGPGGASAAASGAGARKAHRQPHYHNVPVLPGSGDAGALAPDLGSTRPGPLGANVDVRVTVSLGACEGGGAGSRRGASRLPPRDWRSSVGSASTATSLPGSVRVVWTPRAAEADGAQPEPRPPEPPASPSRAELDEVAKEAARAPRLLFGMEPLPRAEESQHELTQAWPRKMPGTPRQTPRQTLSEILLTKGTSPERLQPPLSGPESYVIWAPPMQQAAAVNLLATAPAVVQCGGCASSLARAEPVAADLC